jgi:SAM-dependent methyltransferase
VIGVDSSEVEIQRASERAQKNNISNTKFEVGNIRRLDFSDSSFDAVFSHNVLEHISKPIEVLLEMKRVLKPGGIIGIRNVDFGGALVAPDDDGMILEKHIPLLAKEYENEGGNSNLGRQLGILLYEAGFEEIKMSASYEYVSDPEGRGLVVDFHVDHISRPIFVEWALGNEVATVEELEAIKNAYRKWQKIPGAFGASSHCEAIGRKA